MFISNGDNRGSGKSNKKPFAGWESDMKKKYNKKALKSAAARKADYAKPDNKYESDYRSKNKLYRGKYYGPDVFKGNMETINRYKELGGRKSSGLTPKQFAKMESGYKKKFTKMRSYS